MNQYEILYLDTEELFHTVTVKTNTMQYAVLYLQMYYKAKRILSVRKLSFWTRLYRFLSGEQVAIIEPHTEE